MPRNHSAGTRSSTADSELLQAVEAQSEQMRKTLTHYLQRAATRTSQYLAPPIAVQPIAERITRSLGKLFTDPGVAFCIDIPSDFQVRMAEVDLHEIVGNILENACKYGADNVRLSVSGSDRTLMIDDDGPGFPDAIRYRLTERGVRADSLIEGEGLGLAASREMMESYGGQLDLDSSPQDGARIILRFR